jgi:hypothetical protein
MPRITAWRLALLAVLLFETIMWSAQDEPIHLERVFEAAAVDEGLAGEALADLATNWRSVDAAMLVEMVGGATDPIAHHVSHSAPPPDLSWTAERPTVR